MFGRVIKGLSVAIGGVFALISGAFFLITAVWQSEILWNTFPLFQIIAPVVCYVLYKFDQIGAYVTSDLSEEGTEKALRESSDIYGMFALFALGITFGGMASYYTNTHEWTIGLFLICIIPVLAYGLSVFVGSFVCGFYFGRRLPILLVGIYAAFTGHPAAAAMKKQAMTTRPSETVEAELASVFERQDTTDKELWKLYHELPARKRWAWRFKLHKRAKQARELHRTADAHRAAVEEEDELAHQAHETERAKRAAADK